MTAMPVINYILCIGRRCNATNFLKLYGLRRYATPFEHIIIDFETACHFIATRFDRFMEDVTYFNGPGMARMILESNGRPLPDVVRLNTRFTPAHPSPNICYWNRICLYRHIDFERGGDVAKVERRIARFLDIYDHHKDTTILFYISETVDCVDKYMDNVCAVRDRYGIGGYMVVVVCCPSVVGGVIVRGNITFILKTVPSKDAQRSEPEDNNLNWAGGTGPVNFGDVYDMMAGAFHIELLDVPKRE